MSNGPVIQMQGLAALTARLTALSASAQGKPIKAALRATGSVVKKKSSSGHLMTA
jgi:hypothetical protein